MNQVLQLNDPIHERKNIDIIEIIVDTGLGAATGDMGARSVSKSISKGVNNSLKTSGKMVTKKTWNSISHSKGIRTIAKTTAQATKTFIKQTGKTYIRILSQSYKDVVKESFYRTVPAWFRRF